MTSALWVVHSRCGFPRAALSLSAPLSPWRHCLGLFFDESAPLSLPGRRKCIKPGTSYLQSSLEQHPP
ncbi:hypothetical protein K438DRAFT_1859207 [Mycena galopus ATCC 62051]|nr:hypothetical protein K438DRAFT_1859207 [Mycena galopus ATCC 62051]